MRTLLQRLRSIAVFLFVVWVVAGSFGGDIRPWVSVKAADPCLTPPNAIVAENCKAGAPDTEWDLGLNPSSGDASIQGFAAEFSVNVNGIVHFKVSLTPGGPYHLNIYRMGYYGGAGARLVARVPAVGSLSGIQQADCPTAADTGMTDCGAWIQDPAAIWDLSSTPTPVTSGIYFAKAVRDDVAGASHIFFVVRNDASTSDMIVKTSDTTWQAYNSYGGNSFYVGGATPAAGSSPPRSYKLSYNRPFNTRGNGNARSFVFSAEYPMVRFLEANGYDVSYMSTADLARGVGAANPILAHKVFMSSGHDEYWSGQERTNVEAARNAGKHLVFASANEIYWKTRWEDNYRTLVSYKETWANAKIDPTPAWTGTWRDPRFSPEGGRPENAVSGQIFTVDCCTVPTGLVPPADGRMRFWRNTDVATAAASNLTAQLPAGVIGYEWDEDLDNGARPAGIIRMSTTTVNPVDEHLFDYGNTFAPDIATHHLTLYKHASGALVFGAGSIQWSWGLDNDHDLSGPLPNLSMQQAMVNLFADMGVQPGVLPGALLTATGLHIASASTDTVAPTSAIDAFPVGTTIQRATPVNIIGTASDIGGVVGGVEVSVDGGATWHPANGRETWSYTWIPNGTSAVIRSRAVDDSGNLEAPGVGMSIAVQAPPQEHYTIWNAGATPGLAAANDASALELGVRFRADVAGYITGIRFYKGPGNTGIHVGHLWSNAGVQLAAATFTGEATYGWQEVSFATPVAITANTTYVASYFGPNGHYGFDAAYFQSSGHDNAPLHALASGVDGGNGVFQSGGGFPGVSFNAANYWVDVVFSPTVAVTTDVKPPVISGLTATPIDATSATIQWTTDEPSSSSVAFGLSSSTLNLSASGASGVVSHSVTLSGLSANTTYYYRVTSTDASSNSAIAPGIPASFTASSAHFVDTTVADFTATGSTLDANGYVGEHGNGEILLKPTVGTEFSTAEVTATGLPAGWSAAVLSPGGSATVTGGQLVLNGANVRTDTVYTPDHAIEFVATFSGAPNEHVGLGAIDATSTTFNSPPWAIFTTGSSGTTLSARTTLNVGSNESITNIGSSYLNAPHLFRIMWTSTSTTYFVDGQLVAQHSFPPPGPAAPSASDLVVDGNSVRVDWVHMSPYAASTAFLSRIFDANGAVAWGALAWTADTPPGTSVTMRTRTGNTPVPDLTWTPFGVISANGGAIGATARYVQYRADLTTTDPSQTPVLYDVTIGFPGLAARTTPTMTWNNPADITYGTALGGSQLNATANVPGTFSYSPAAGTVLSAGAAQTLSVTFTPTDTVTYSTATAQASINVLKAPASVTPAAASKTYGTSDPTLTGMLTGFLASDAVTASYSRTAGETVAGGPYTISAVLSPASALTNYTITYNTAAFTINKATASVTPAAASKTYGTSDPAFTGTLSGFLAKDGVTASYSRTAGETVAGNPYTISAVLNPASVLANYTITYNTAAFTINKAAASVTPASASKVYGASDPVLTGTLSGFLASDGVTASYTRTPGETVAGSPYKISAALSPAGVLGNYQITFNTASFTITKGQTTVTAPTSSNASTTYGDAVTFTASVSPVSPSTAIPTGTITFNDNGVPIPGGTALVNATGQASVTVTGVNAGSRLITATYSGDANFFGSGPSVSTTQTVAQATGTATMTVSTLTPVYSDLETFTATFTPSKAGGPAPAKINFKVGTQALPDVAPTLSGGNYVYTWTGQMIEPSPFGTGPTGQMKPGAHVVTAAFNDPNFTVTNPAKGISINKEDARVASTTPATVSLAGSATGTVTLSASVKDITAAIGDPAWDNNPGDIRNATVSFVDRGTNAVLGTVAVTLSGTDPTQGVATLNWAVNLGTATSRTFSIGFIVSNYYNRNNAADNVNITVSK